MSPPGSDTPLQHLRVGAGPEHLRAVVALQDQPVTPGEPFLHSRGDHSGIGAASEGQAVCDNAKTAGFPSIMGDRESFDGKAPDPASLVPPAAYEINGNLTASPASDNLMESATGSVDRDLQLSGQGIRSSGMIDMLMGDQDGGYPLFPAAR